MDEIQLATSFKEVLAELEPGSLNKDVSVFVEMVL